LLAFHRTFSVSALKVLSYPQMASALFKCVACSKLFNSDSTKYADTIAFAAQDMVENFGGKDGSHRQRMEYQLENLGGRKQFYSLFKDLMAADFAQPCVVNAGIDETVATIRPYLREDMARWRRNVPDGSEDGDSDPDLLKQIDAVIDTELDFIKGFVTQRFELLVSTIDVACDSLDGCQTGSTCLSHDCGGDHCVQGSLHPQCMSTADLADDCGCMPGNGWSRQAKACAQGAKTSDSEAQVCAGGGAPALTTHDMDGCGCSEGAGWSGHENACVDGAHTKDEEAVACANSGQGLTDGCGCVQGSGWSSRLAACAVGETTVEADRHHCPGTRGSG
jgi:hypothetical protein